MLHARLGHRARAIADLEAAIARFQHRPESLDQGHLASAELELGKQVYSLDRAKGRALVERAVARFAGAVASWAAEKQDAVAWLATHR